MGCGLRGLRSLVYKMRQEVRAGRLGPSGSHTGWFKGEGRVGEEEAPVIPLQRQMAEGAQWMDTRTTNTRRGVRGLGPHGSAFTRIRTKHPGQTPP